MRGVNTKDVPVIVPMQQQDVAMAMPPMPAFSMLSVLQALPDAVLVLDAASRIVFANHAAADFLGTSEKSLIGKTLADLLGHNHPVIDSFATAQSGQALTLRDLDMLSKPVSHLSVVPMEDAPVVVLSWRHDILPMRHDWIDRIRQSLKPAQQLTQMLAHEVRNPLAGIRGAAQLLQKAALHEDDLALARLIEDETQRIARLVEKVNVFDSAPRSEFCPLNIHTVTDHVTSLVRAGICANIKVETRYDPSLPEIEGHADRLIQAVLNIVKNAAEANAKVITLRSYYDTAAGFHPESGQRLPVTLEIADNGHGMDAQTTARLFEPCFTTKTQGEGLGLAIVSQIIDDHGGVVTVSSHAGATAFRISLPMLQTKPRHKPAKGSTPV
jgi:two-component system, NtrC family, nitrogen regulation sensor histidine kinase GlnL